MGFLKWVLLGFLSFFGLFCFFKTYYLSTIIYHIINDYNNNSYDNDGYDKEGYNKNGYDKYGYNRNGYDKNDYNKEGYHVLDPRIIFDP